MHKLSKLNPDDEIAVTMTAREFYSFFDLLAGLPAAVQLFEAAEPITLEWLDKKRAEFP